MSIKFRCPDIPKEFDSLSQMHRALKGNVKLLIDKKKSAIKFTDSLSLPFMGHAGSGQVEKTKAEAKDLEFGDFIYPIINTTNYMDSHRDVHINGIWDKSLPDQKGKIYYVTEHDLSIGKVISYPDEVEMMVKEINWKEVGKEYEGKTQALIFKALLTDASNEDAFKAFKKNKAIQNSVRMIYVSLDLAINNGSMDYKEEKRIWDKYYPVIANKEVANELGYFWAITEAKIYKEGSAVLFGSNDATGISYTEPKHIEPPAGTQQQNKDAAKSTYLKELNNLNSKLKKITA